jgi:iron(III) transport system permease protein
LCYYFPFVFIQVSGALERMDPTLEESARIAGANQMTVIRRITMPLVVPAIAAGAMLILISSLSHFGVPAILGFSNGIFTLPTKIYELIYRASGSFEGIRRGASLSILLVAVVVLALALQRRVLRAGRYDIIRGKSMRPMLIKLRGWKVPLLLVCFVFLVITVILPLCTIFGVGFLKAYGVPMKLANMTLNNFKYVLFESKMARDSIRNSFFLSITSAVITMLVGTMIAYVIVKIQPRGKGVLEVLGILPYSIPGIVLAVGVILTWSGAFYLNLYNTIWIILIAYIARYMAFSMKSASASLEQVHDSLEEASRTCGASHFESLLDVTLPLIRPGMVAGFFLIFLPAMRELTTSLLLYGPFTRTMGVAIYSINEEGYTVQACALAGVAIIIIVLGELLLRFVTRERRGQ